MKSRPYNDSLFNLREAYYSVFGSELNKHGLKAVDEEDDQNIRTSKLFSVVYKINILPCLGEYVYYHNGMKIMNEGTSFLQMCIDSNQLEIFEKDNIKQLIDFKW